MKALLALAVLTIAPIQASAGIFHHGANYLECEKAEKGTHGFVVGLKVEPNSGEIRYSGPLFSGFTGSFVLDRDAAYNLGQGELAKLVGLKQEQADGHSVVFRQAGSTGSDYLDIDEVLADGHTAPFLAGCRSMRGEDQDWLITLFASVTKRFSALWA